MKAPDQFSLPLKSIKEGTRILEYELKDDFFQSLDNELIGKCFFYQQVIVDKRSDLLVLIFSHHGYIQADCDRCLELIKIPVSGEKRFVIKFVDEEQEDEEDILYVLTDEDRYDLAPLINEVVTLSLPLVKVYDCDSDPNAPCNREVLKYLNREKTSQEDLAVWDQLKNLKLED